MRGFAAVSGGENLPTFPASLFPLDPFPALSFLGPVEFALTPNRCFPSVIRFFIVRSKCLHASSHMLWRVDRRSCRHGHSPAHIVDCREGSARRRKHWAHWQSWTLTGHCAVLLLSTQGDDSNMLFAFCGQRDELRFSTCSEAQLGRASCQAPGCELPRGCIDDGIR